MGKAYAEHQLQSRRRIWSARNRYALSWLVAGALPALVYGTYTALGALTLAWTAHVTITGLIALSVTLPLSNKLSSAKANESYDEAVRVRVGSDGLAVDDTFIAWSRFRNVVVAKTHLVIWYAPSQRLDLPRPSHPTELVKQIQEAKTRHDAQVAPISLEDVENLASSPDHSYRRANRAILLQVATNTRTPIAARVASTRALRGDESARKAILESLGSIVCDAHWHLIHDTLVPTKT